MKYKLHSLRSCNALNPLCDLIIWLMNYVAKHSAAHRTIVFLLNQIICTFVCRGYIDVFRNGECGDSADGIKWTENEHGNF